MIRTRFAPSPTGFLHIGGLRTALYSYAFAKSQGGKFILRIEDTDLNRFVPGTTEGIYKILKIFGLEWDEGPQVGGPYSSYIQSERVGTGIYKKYALSLVEKGYAYYCFCPPESKEVIEKRHEKKEIKLRDKCRHLDLQEALARVKKGEKAAIRLRIPENEKISFYDFVLEKEISWETQNIDEVTLLKSDGFPTYHLGVVVDDALMKISHIIRGRDWLPSTPIHLLLFKYLRFELPQIGHLTDILDPEGGKLSKRKGSISCEEFLAEGYLPEAILNFIMLLGWAPKDNRENFSLSEFVAKFGKGQLQIANPVFNRKKLDWFNGLYIRGKSDGELFNLLKPFAPKGASDDLIYKTIPLVKERIRKLGEYSGLVNFLVKRIKSVKADLVPGGKSPNETKAMLALILKNLEVVTEEGWKAREIEQMMLLVADKTSWKRGDFFMIFRVAISGSRISPPLFDSIEILGKKETLLRLKTAIELLE